MTKSIMEMRVHSSKGINGTLFARRVGEEHLKGMGITHVFVTRDFNTTRTAGEFAQGAGDFQHKQFEAIDIAVDPQYSEEHWSLARISEEGVRLREIFLAATSHLPDGYKALFVANSDLIVLLIHAMMREVIEPLNECEGIRFTADSSGRFMFQELRF